MVNRWILEEPSHLDWELENGWDNREEEVIDLTTILKGTEGELRKKYLWQLYPYLLQQEPYMSKDQIEEFIWDWNKRNRPPFIINDLLSKLDWCWRTFGPKYRPEEF